MSCKIVSGEDLNAVVGFCWVLMTFSTLAFPSPSHRVSHLHPEPLPTASHAHHLHPHPQQTELLVGPQQPLHHCGQAGWHGYAVRRLHRYASAARHQSVAQNGMWTCRVQGSHAEFKNGCEAFTAHLMKNDLCCFYFGGFVLLFPLVRRFPGFCFQM